MEASSKERSETVEEWRASVFDRLLLAILATGAGIWLICFVQGIAGARAWWTLQTFALLIPASLMRTWPRTVRAILLLSAFLTVSTFVIFRSGFSLPNIYVVALLLAIVLALTVGRALAWALILGFVGVQAVAAVYFAEGGELAAGIRLAPHLPGNWLRVVCGFAALAGVTVTALTYVTHRMEAALTQNGTLIGELGAEIKDRAAALKVREALEAGLREADKLKSLGTLAGGVAHDFNNLLMVILGNVELLELKLKPEDCEEEKRDLKAAIGLAQALTQQLLLFGQRRSGLHEPVDLADTVEKNTRLLRRVLPASVTVQLTPSPPEETLEPLQTMVLGCPTELDQVVLNLCINAGEAMPDGGTLRLELEHKQRPKPGETALALFAVLSVKDSGCGMDEHTREHLFEPFFTTKPGGGSGLGLSIVHGIVEQHQGFLEVKTAAGEGTEIVVYLPLAASNKVAQLSPDKLPTGEKAAGTPILLAEDNDTVRKLMQRTLVAAGFEVTACANGALALTEFRQKPNFYRAVVTDAVMPVLGGRALHDALREDGNDIPFLFCTGYDGSTLPEEFLEKPGRALLLKPFAKEELIRHLNELLEQASGRDSLRG